MLNVEFKSTMPNVVTPANSNISGQGQEPTLEWSTLKGTTWVCSGPDY
jgi:hypothetical protein